MLEMAGQRLVAAAAAFAHFVNVLDWMCEKGRRSSVDHGDNMGIEFGWLSRTSVSELVRWCC